jgi:D-psicose/D-tagatose/L-ribulose 3-epimerase
MNKFGMYFQYWAVSWPASLPDMIQKAAEAGFKLIEVDGLQFLNLTIPQRQHLCHFAQEHNVEIAYSLGLPKTHDIASPDLAAQSRGVKLLQDLAEAIGQVHGQYLCGVLYGRWPAAHPYGKWNRQEYLDRSVKNMQKAIQAAQDHQVVFAIEAVNRYEHFLINTSAEAAAYVQAVDSANCKMMLDTFHMNIEESSLVGAIHGAGSSLAYLHLSENTRAMPGSGAGWMPWKDIFCALKTIQYAGPLVIEVFPRATEEVIRELNIYRDLHPNQDLHLLAMQAQEFLHHLMIKCQN